VLGAHMAQPAFGEGMLEMGIRVLGNFADSSEKIGGSPTISEKLFKSGAATSILAAANKYPSNSGIVLNSVQALNDIALHEPGIAGALMQDGLVELLVDLMQKYSYDQEMMTPTVELTSTAMESPASADQFMAHDGLPALKGVLDETSEDAQDILVNAAVTINILAAKEKYRRTIDDLGLVTATLKLLNQRPNDREMVPEALGMLSRMAASAIPGGLDVKWGKAISQRIALDGMPTIMKIIELNDGDVEIMDHAFKLLGFLAYLHENVQPIIGLGGLKCIFSTMTKYNSDRNLMERCMKTLDFISSDADVATALKEDNGIEKVKTLLNHYKESRPITQSGMSILIRLGVQDVEKDFQVDEKSEDVPIPQDDPPSYAAYMLA